ncbi:hypothetical protein [Dysgonomonas sp. ZJ279]|uniref:hypothetical protein n=1 Tax=Dysgonomonas sp. ZJ279 TaxID=2709796 RepID=UPI0013EA434A|nr:hypothetical protein [Dysgonomonas sp. ZJ279]
MDELKNSWLSLDERLKKQEVLKENIIKEMLNNKTNKALSKLTNFELFGSVLTLLVYPVFIYQFSTNEFNTIQSIFVYSLLVFLTVAVCSQLWKMYRLLKVDFGKPLSYNINIIQRYRIYLKKEKSFNIIALFFVLGYILETAITFPHGLDAWRWVAMICIFVGACVMTVWQYKKIYKANIESILKSLDELKELEEEKD